MKEYGIGIHGFEFDGKTQKKRMFRFDATPSNIDRARKIFDDQIKYMERMAKRNEAAMKEVIRKNRFSLIAFAFSYMFTARAIYLIMG